MTRKQLKNLLIEKGNEIEVKDFSESILKRVNHKVINNENSPIPALEAYEKSKSRLRKRIFYPVFAAACAVILCVIIASTSLGGFTSGNKQLEVERKIGKAFANEVLALGNVISTDKQSKEGANNTSFAEFDKDNKSPTEEYDGIADSINHYLFTANALLYDNHMTTVTTENSDKEYSNYRFKMTVSLVDQDGYDIEYLVYYNLREMKNYYSMAGVVFVGGEKYRIAGESNVIKREVATRINIFTSESTRISIANETAVNENAYEYNFYEEDELVKSVYLEGITKNHERKIEMEITENSVTTSYEFVHKKHMMECEYERNSERHKIIISADENYYIYKFDNGAYTVKLAKVKSPFINGVSTGV